MNKLIRLSFLLLLSLNVALPVQAAQALYIHKGQDPVERAGTIIIKKYGPKDYAVLVGEDRQYKFWNFPGGMVEKKDKYTSVAASRETYEETAQQIRYGGKYLSKQRYLYSPKHKIQLFVVRDDSWSVRKLNREVKKVNKMKNLPHSYREISAYRAIPVKHIIDAAECLNQTNHPRRGTHGCYFVVSRGNPKAKQPGDVVRLERHYLATIAKDLPRFKTIVQQIAP